MNDPSPAEPDTHSDSSAPGGGIIGLSILGTVVFVLAGALAALFMGGFMVAYVSVSLVEFALGTIVFALAFLRAVDRSRTHTIGVGGLFFGSGSAPRPVRVRLMGAFAVQILVSIAVAWSHVYTALAFGVLAPMWSLGFSGLWVAAYGTFPIREFDPRVDRGVRSRPARPDSSDPKD
ncbi:MAG: hypothetical protein EBX39_07100 [Actinobacteria bacterium]|nr:hypothetical protein [Actinomycetota bacterium]